MTRLIFVLLGVLLLGAESLAENAEEKGYQIAQKAASQDDGYADYTANGKMILRNRAGQESVREFDFKQLEHSDGDMSLLVFNWPGDIRDTALLTHVRAAGNDLQWLYLPAVRRVKRITSSGQSGSFVGSEFTYEDMRDQEVDNFTYLWLDDEVCFENKLCHVIERLPKYSSSYSKQKVWLDVEALRVHKIEYFNRQMEKAKTLTIESYEKYNNRFWRASSMSMINHVTGKSTELKWTNYQFSNGLSAADFSTRALKRAR